MKNWKENNSAHLTFFKPYQRPKLSHGTMMKNKTKNSTPVGFSDLLGHLSVVVLSAIGAVIVTLLHAHHGKILYRTRRNFYKLASILPAKWARFSLRRRIEFFIFRNECRIFFLQALNFFGLEFFEFSWHSDIDGVLTIINIRT